MKDFARKLVAVQRLGSPSSEISLQHLSTHFAANHSSPSHDNARIERQSEETGFLIQSLAHFSPPTNPTSHQIGSPSQTESTVKSPVSEPVSERVDRSSTTGLSECRKEVVTINTCLHRRRLLSPPGTEEGPRRVDNYLPVSRPERSGSLAMPTEDSGAGIMGSTMTIQEDSSEESDYEAEQP